MEKFLEIKIKELLKGDQLNFENIVPVTYDLCKVIKKKKSSILERALVDLIYDACVQNILGKYKVGSSLSEYMSDSEDEAGPVKIKKHFDVKVELLDVDLALLDYTAQIITSIVKKFYENKKRCLCF